MSSKLSETSHPRAGRLLRLGVRVVAPLLGEVRGLKELLDFQGFTRASAIFAASILIPGLALVYFGLTGVRAEELQVVAEVEARADAMATAVAERSEALFSGFEGAAKRRLESGSSATESLPELSPFLRVTLRLDADNELAAPFEKLPLGQMEDQRWYLTGTWQEALLAEQSGSNPARAAALYADAARTAPGLSASGQATFAMGRALMKAGEDTEALKTFANVVAEFGHVRDVYGFRLGDLAQLKRGEILLHQDPEIGVGSLQALTEELVTATWIIGRGGEAAVAARALELLEDHAPKDWVAAARGRLEDRSRSLFWAEQHYPDLGRLLDGVPQSGTGTFVYTRIDDALWATLRWNEDRYCFALDVEGLLADLAVVAHQTGRADDELDVTLVGPDDPGPGTEALARRSLAPWLPGWSIAVVPTAPEALHAEQRRKRLQRVGIIVFALVMTITGSVVSVRLVRRELDLARMKADFAANVSHELRSPITQIRLKGESLMLGLTSGEEATEKAYEAIVRESERLSRLVDNVLDFAAIERGAKRYSFRPADLGETVRSSVESARYSMETRGLAMEVDIQEDMPVVFHDPEAVSQVIHNLISNAAKYGRDGGWIGIEARLVGGGVTVEVADKGIGIHDNDIPHLFDQFYRSDDPAARRRKGTGIGLTIVQYIMHAHSGDVSVRSQPGSGTTFTLHFPLRSPSGA